LIAFIGFFSTPKASAQPAFEVDVVVYGGTSAGVIAAYAAKMSGKSVLLVEPGRHLGGMSSGGLGLTDIGNKYAINGLALDFYRRMGSYYGQFEAWTFEPKAAEQIFESYVDEAGVEVLFSRRLKDLEKEGTDIQTITLEYAGEGPSSDDLQVRAKMFIDASYEGDLMAASGASYIVGREPNSKYNENHNGVQLRDRHQFPDGVDPYVVEGDPSSGLLPEINGVGVEPDGTGDKKVQAYNFRMCLCQGEDRIPFSRPENYNPDRYELLIRWMEQSPWDSLQDGFIISRMPNGKSDWNNRGGFSTDYIGKNWEYPEADYETRAEIWKDHEEYQKGLVYFLANNEQVPDHIRKEMQSWGYCPDEFLDTEGWPHQLYVREARRLVGEYVTTEAHCLGETVVEDGIAMAAYTMDSHNTQRVVVEGSNGPMVKNEGNVEVGGGTWDDLGGEVIVNPYPISYRSIIPKREEVTNLLVPVALSASHIAFGSIRMEPVFMVLGQSAAVAASMAIDAEVPVQQVDVEALQRELKVNPLADGSIPEVLVDDADTNFVEVSGDFEERPSREFQSGRDIARPYGPGALVSENVGTVRFEPEISHAGRYKVYLFWSALPGRKLAVDMPVAINHAGGLDRMEVDLTSQYEEWKLLGEYRFVPGENASLEITNDENRGTVIADAVLFVPVDSSNE
jgi:hypothetical protein